MCYAHARTRRCLPFEDSGPPTLGSILFEFVDPGGLMAAKGVSFWIALMTAGAQCTPVWAKRNVTPREPLWQEHTAHNGGLQTAWGLFAPSKSIARHGLSTSCSFLWNRRIDDCVGGTPPSPPPPVRKHTCSEAMAWLQIRG